MPTTLRLLPPGVGPDARRVLLTRVMRGFADGFVSVLLPVHLAALGFGGAAIGGIASVTLAGSALATLAAGLLAGRLGVRRVLALAAMTMALTGLGFATLTASWALFVVAFVGTLNPSAGDVSLFLPVEQTAISASAPASARTALFARYRMVGSLATAFGSLAAAIPAWLAARDLVASEERAVSAMFLLYAAIGGLTLLPYRRLSAVHAERRATAPLGPSRGRVYRLTALFSLDSFASGFIVQSMLALWLELKFGLSPATTGVVFFWTGLLTAVSQLLAAPLAARIGLIRTMVYTHLPANILLMAAPLMPTKELALGLLLARALVQSMDAPARSAYVMAAVTEAERPAASAITNAPRGLATAVSPTIAGWMLGMSAFGLPLIIGGGLKVVYDLLLLRAFQHVRLEDE